MAREDKGRRMGRKMVGCEWTWDDGLTLRARCRLGKEYTATVARWTELVAKGDRDVETNYLCASLPPSRLVPC